MSPLSVTILAPFILQKFLSYFTLPPRANAPMGRADRVLVKTGAAHRFLVSESLTLPCPGERGGVPHRTLGHDWMTGCLKNIPEHMNWWEEFESSHDAPQAPNIDGAGGQSGQIGFLLAPWNSPQKTVVGQNVRSSRYCGLKQFLTGSSR